MEQRTHTWKRDAISGLVVLVPVLVTGFVLVWLYQQIAAFTLLGMVSPPLVRVGVLLVGFSVGVLGIGMLMRTTSGNLLEARIDALMNQLPGLRIIYNASKMAIETVFTDSEQLRAPVTLEMWSGARMTGFKTGKTTADGRELVFVPTAPNITTGFVVEISPEDITENDETIEDALVRVLSCGFGDTDRTPRSSSPTHSGRES